MISISAKVYRENLVESTHFAKCLVKNITNKILISSNNNSWSPCDVDGHFDGHGTRYYNSEVFKYNISEPLASGAISVKGYNHATNDDLNGDDDKMALITLSHHTSEVCVHLLLIFLLIVSLYKT